MYILNIPLIGLPRLGFLPEEHRLGDSKVPAMLLLMVMATAATWLAAWSPGTSSRYTA